MDSRLKRIIDKKLEKVSDVINKQWFYDFFGLFEKYKYDDNVYDVIDALNGKSGMVYANAYSYTVNNGENIEALMDKTDSAANSALQNLLKTADTVLSKGNITGSAVDELNALKTEILSYFGSSITQNANGSYTVAASVTRVRMEPYIKELRAVLASFVNIL